jgi:hypothetical protein
MWHGSHDDPRRRDFRAGELIAWAQFAPTRLAVRDCVLEDPWRRYIIRHGGPGRNCHLLRLIVILANLGLFTLFILILYTYTVEKRAPTRAGCVVSPRDARDPVYHITLSDFG